MSLGLVLALAGGEAAAEAPPALADGVPLYVLETQGIDRVADPVTFAVPLPESAGVKNPGQLVVLGPQGQPVPSQFRVTQRYGALGDGNQPIRWLLVDLQVDVAAGATAVYTLKRRDGEKDPPPPKLKVKVQTKKIKVHTGVAKVFLDPESMNFVDRLYADLNGDRKVKKNEVVLDRPADAGFVLKDRFGSEYASTRWPATFTVEEDGPLRVVIRADGRHGPAAEGQGIGRDFFMYRTRLTFYAGKPFVRVQHTLRNAYLEQPLGSIGFQGYRLQTELAAKFKKRALKAAYGGDGAVPVEVSGASRLYQDSSGGDYWNQSPGTTFRGYRVYRGAAQTVEASGNQAAGSMHVGDGTAGVTLAMRFFFENFPKGFQFDGDGGLRFDIFPEEFATFQWLDDGQQKTTDFLLAVSGKGSPPPADVVRAFQNPLRPFAEIEWVRASRAWGDLGDLDKPVHAPQTMRSYDDGKLASLYNSAFTNSSYSFGWYEFGEMTWARNTHTTGSPRNKLTYFDKFAMAGSPSAFRIVELFALHSQDIRTYHIEGFSREKHPTAVLWEALPVWSYSPDKIYRDTLDPALAAHRAGIPSGGHLWNAFDMEHFVVDDLYEYYLMTGDYLTLDALKAIGECVRTWPIYSLTKAPGSTRGVGWTMRGLMKIYQVTGDQRFLDAADDLVASVAATYGQSPSPTTGYIYHYVTRYPPHANHIADDEYDLPWQLAVVIHGMFLHHGETGSATSRQIALDVTDYLVDFSWNGVAMNEALAVDDHTYVNPKYDNTGINTWVPSALILAYRQNPKPLYLWIAETMYNSIPGLTDPLSYNGYGIHHWWHPYRALILGY